jgi:putative membrane protein
MQMKRIKRASVVLIAVALVVSLTMVIPASARTGSSDVEVLSSEFVVATMASSGTIEDVQVFNWLSLNGNGTVTVKEEKAFDDVGGFQAVKGFTKPSVEGDYIIWPEINVSEPTNVIASTVLSESSVEEAKMRIPLNVRFKYWFDGEPVTDLETITGKSGRFKMELTLRNESKEMSVVEYKDPATGEMVTERVETYLPLVILPYDWYFDNSIFYNLECDPTGLVVWMPDFYNVGWSIPLFPPATEESHTIWVAADVKDFAMPPLTLAVAFSFPETNQTNIAATLAPYMKAFYDGMVQVNEGIGTPTTDPSLLFGITAVNDGLEQLGAGLAAAPVAITTQFIPGLAEMIQKVPAAIAGIGSPTTPDTLMYADAAVTGGLQGMSAGIGSPTASDTLLYAMAAMAAGLNETKAGIGSATTDNTLLYAVNAIQGGLNDIAAGIGAASTPDTLLYAVTAVQGGLNSILSGAGSMLAALGTAANPATIIGGLTAILGGLQTMSVGLGAPGQPGTIIDGLTTMATGLNGSIIPGLQGIMAALSPGGGLGTLYDYTLNVAKPITDAADPTIWLTQQAMMNGYAGGLNTIIGPTPADGLRGMYNGLNAQIIPGLTTMKGGLDAQAIPGLTSIIAGLTSSFVPGLQTIVAGIGSASTPGTLLYAMAALGAGLSDIQAGIGDATQAGTLLYGAAAIQGGLLQIAAGIGSQAAPDTLLYAVNAVEAGLNQMKAGIGDAGVSDTMLYAMAAIQGGLQLLKDGLSSGDPSNPALLEGLLLVSGGLDQLNSGLDEAVTGIGSAGTPDTLLYGTDQLLSGTTQLNEGTMALEDGLLAVLTQFSMTNAQLEAIAKRGEEFDHLLGRAQDADNNIRFVYQSKPTYNYTEGSSTSWIVAIVLSIIIALGLAVGGILLARRSSA